VTAPATTPAAPGVAAAIPQPPPPWRLAADPARQRAPQADWPDGRRAAALARLDATGLPDGSQEDWRYTSLTAYAERWAAYLAAPPADDTVAFPAVAGMPPPAVAVQIIDGVFRAGGPAAPTGLHVGSLGQLRPALRARAAELVARADGLPVESLVDLNTALAADVVVIATEPGRNLGDTPMHVTVHGTGSPAFGQPRLLVDVAANSRLTLTIEHSGAAGTLSNAVTQAWVGAGAHLDLVRAQCLPDDGMLTDTTRVELADGASAKVTSADLGALLCRQSLTVVLAGKGAEASVDGLFLADGQSHLDNRTRLEHRAPGTRSRESFRGLADGHGRGVFNGKIIVLPGAAGSNATLSNRNLLLAPTAEIDTKPELEIHVDDVRCSHGATTGQLDAAALFYLRSRGLDLAAARQVLTAAFLREALAGIVPADVRSRLEARLEARLGDAVPVAGPVP